MKESNLTVGVQIVFYSMYGHIYKMAKAIEEGVKQVAGANVSLFQVLELVPEEVLIKSGAKEAQKQFQHIPVAKTSQLVEADAIIFGTPTRFGNMCAQMRNFLDQTGGIWAKGGLIGKVASVFSSTATQHGGQETTITSFHSTLLHHGMIIVGVPYSAAGLTYMDAVSGGSPYGSTTLAGADGKREPTANELEIARFQGKHVAEITKLLKIGKSVKL
ncbi:MAG: NAD(P)H:quinone oxidoreductase [Gammaproteobacteria bacterium]|nr:NAD(P)H:quinone oxidoreductase [Gammaproteobacteria bacterium]